MTKSYKEDVAGVDTRVGALFKAVPATMTPYSQMVKAASAEGALSTSLAGK